MTKQLHDGDDAGVILGAAITDKVAFFGSTPVTQQSVTNASNTTATTSNLATDLTSLLSALAALGLITTT